MSNYTKLFSNLKQLGIFSYSNLFPMTTASNREQYEKYLQEYIDTCDVYYLSWDKYVFDKGNSKADYFLNMSLCREYAEKANIPFWSYIQAGSQWNDAAPQDLIPTDIILMKANLIGMSILALLMVQRESSIFRLFSHIILHMPCHPILILNATEYSALGEIKTDGFTMPKILTRKFPLLMRF